MEDELARLTLRNLEARFAASTMSQSWADKCISNNTTSNHISLTVRYSVEPRESNRSRNIDRIPVSVRYEEDPASDVDMFE